LYSQHNYITNHVWNSNEINIQIGIYARTRVLAWRGPNATYSTIPKSWEWLNINYEINDVGGVIPKFYIFKGGKSLNDYIKFSTPKIYMIMPKKAWIIFFLLKEFLSIFKKFVQGGVSFTNRCLLVMNGHGSHVTLKTIEHA
jgi:hypothetical protein